VFVQNLAPGAAERLDLSPPADSAFPEQLLKKQSSMLNSVRRSENRSRKLQKYAI